ncbi:unnamed protein product, partial [Allacma fusca]
ISLAVAKSPPKIEEVQNVVFFIV